MSHSVSQSGFFIDSVQGHLRPSAQITQWNIAAPNPSGLRHVESGAIKRTANQNNRGGFTAQKESGVPITFGEKFVVDGNAFSTDTACLTLNFGQINENEFSHFDRMYNGGSGEAADNLVGFNFRYWVGELDAFDVVAKSGSTVISGIKPQFFFRESADWRQNYKLELTEGGSGVSGVHILPSSMPNFPNIYSRERDISISGSFVDREFTNFIYTRAFFPSLPTGQTYKLGTYGGLGEKTFRLKFSYDYTSFGANISNPEDLSDDPVFIEQDLPDLGISETVSGWWQMNNSSPQLSRSSGFPNRTMTLVETTEDAAPSITLASGIVSSGTPSGVCAFFRSNRRDLLSRNNPFTGQDTMDFSPDMDDGAQSFTITGWFALNDPSGADPAATGVGARIPDLNTGIVCKWNFRFGLEHLQYQLYFHRALNRIVWNVNNDDNRRIALPYNYLNVDSQDNNIGSNFGTSETFTEIGAGGGGIVPEKWYFFACGYDRDAPAEDGSNTGNIFLRINDGPIDRIGLCSSTQGLRDAGGSTAVAPFAIAGFTRNAGNGSISYAAGSYDNITVHRGAVLSNEQLLTMYNKGFGQEFPIGIKKDIDFSLPPELAIQTTDPDPVPLRRGLRAWYNFNEPSGITSLSDSQRYQNLEPNNANVPTGIQISSGILPNSIINSASSGSMQIRSTSTTFEDGQTGNSTAWRTQNSQTQPYPYCSYTIAAYVRFPQTGTASDICGSWEEATNERFWHITKESDDSFTFGRANGTTIGQPSDLTVATTDFNANDWYLVVVRATMTSNTNYDLRMDITNLRTGTNNSSEATDETFHWTFSIPDSSVPFSIGSLNILSAPVVGEFDIAGMGTWFRSLDANEISRLVNNDNGLNFGDSTFGKIPRVYWDSDLRRDNDPSTI